MHLSWFLLLALLLLCPACTQKQEPKIEYRTIPVSESWDPLFLGQLDNDWQILLELDQEQKEKQEWSSCRIKLFEPQKGLDERPYEVIYGTWTIEGSAHFYDYDFSTPGYTIHIGVGELEEGKPADLAFYMHSNGYTEYSLPWTTKDPLCYESWLTVVSSFGEEEYRNPGNVSPDEEAL